MITTAGSINSSTLLPITSLRLPLTGSAAAGFAIGFVKDRKEKNKERRNQDYILNADSLILRHPPGDARINRAEYST